ncbi:Putative tRNA/rRNA methyltransferase Rv0881 [Durusdinium trenchii]|uniref:tRNA/rRNA methyltransferase Rv0881 n=1 Tax=Durusdinium trenchii TaxID=1381693 RepID=A0ABP0J2J5_9DINO
MSAWRPLEEKASYNAVEDFAGREPPSNLAPTEGATEPEAIEEAGGAPSGGSLGHPQVCNRPCIYFAAGNCASGAGCSYCHVEHTEPRLETRSLLQIGAAWICYHLRKSRRVSFQQIQACFRMVQRLSVLEIGGC